MIASRNSIIRYALGQRGLQSYRALKQSKKSRSPGSWKQEMTAWLRKRVKLPSGDSPKNHVHPRSKR